MYKHQVTFGLLVFFLAKYINASIIASRTDGNFDIVIYFNGQPLRAGNMINLPAFAQIATIILSNGQRIIANSRGVVNLRVDVLRSGGMAGSVPYGQQNSGAYGNGYGQYGQYQNGQYQNGQYGNPNGQYGNQNYGNGAYSNRYPSNGFFDFFRNLG